MTTETHPHLRTLYAVIDGIPSNRIDLRAIVRDGAAPDPHRCRTIACAVGWAGMHPYFRRLGLETIASGRDLRLNGVVRPWDEVTAEVFGISVVDAVHLFGASFERRRYDPDTPPGSDKELVLARIRNFLQEPAP